MWPTGGGANYWAPLTRKRHIPPHPAQPRHTDHWAPRTRKRHQPEHRPQRPTERSDPTQHAKGQPGDCPGPRKETTTGRNVTRGSIITVSDVVCNAIRRPLCDVAVWRWCVRRPLVGWGALHCPVHAAHRPPGVRCRVVLGARPTGGGGGGNEGRSKFVYLKRASQFLGLHSKFSLSPEENFSGFGCVGGLAWGGGVRQTIPPPPDFQLMRIPLFCVCESFASHKQKV